MSPIDRPDFTGDGEVAEMTAAPETVPRDEDGRRVMVDWSDGPAPPQPDADFEPPSVAEQNGDEPGSFDELDPTAQAIFRDQGGLDTAVSSVATVKAHMGDDRFAAMDDDFESLPTGAQTVIAALLSVDWKPHGPEVMADALDELSDALPLTDEAELYEFLRAHNFIEGD